MVKIAFWFYIYSEGTTDFIFRHLIVYLRHLNLIQLAKSLTLFYDTKIYIVFHFNPSLFYLSLLQEKAHSPD